MNFTNRLSQNGSSICLFWMGYIHAKFMCLQDRCEHMDDKKKKTYPLICKNDK
jgi:hypothetical protein